MKKLFGMTAAALFSLGFFASSADAATVVTADVLNVRQQPTTSSSIVGKVKNGQSLDVTKRLNGWLQITYNGKTAYVSTAYTKETDNTAPAPTAKLYYVNTSVLNVRTGPGTNYGVLGQLRNGETVKVLANAGNEWMKVNYKGKTAYVYKAYVTPAAASVAKAFYAEATAYTPWESKTGITAYGYNIKKNPNMKLIAVDPKVIPLGSKVWVEGYGEAVAGDTGGAIKGKKIDVLMPKTEQALQWGRKKVKVKVLK